MAVMALNDPQGLPKATFPLRVDDVFWRGAALTGTWAWPPNASRVSLSEVLQAMGHGNGDWGDAALCHLHSDAGIDETVWWLSTASTVERCVVNGEALSPGQALRLNDQDMLEVGLLRLRIRTEAPGQPELNTGIPKQDVARAQALFDLTALAKEDSSGLMSAMQRETQSRQSISELVGDVTATWEEGLEALPSNAPLPSPADAPALGPNEHSGSPNDADEALDATLLLSSSPGSRGAPASASAPSPATSPGPQNTTKPHDDLTPWVGERKDPLDQLHERYIDHLLNPRAQRDPLGLSLDKRTQGGSADDPLSHWMAATMDNKGLSDVVDTTQTIDDLIAQLDDHGSVDVLAAEEVDDVLQLFAPEALQQQIQQRDQFGLDLPALTRTEHHSVSLDSPMPMPRAPQTPSPKESS